MVRYLVRKTKHFLFSLRFSILFIFISLFLLTTLSIIAIRTFTFQHELAITSFELIRGTSSAILQELNAAIKPAEIQSEFSAHLIKEGVLDATDSHLTPYTFYLVKNLPLVQRAIWVGEDGRYTFSEKEADGSISTHIGDRGISPPTLVVIHRDVNGEIINQSARTLKKWDRRFQNWYVRVRNEKKFFWTDVRLFHPNGQLGITAVSPVIINNQFRGAFGLNISLEYLSQFMSHQKLSPNGFSFIITKNQDLVAYPFKKPFTEVSAKPNKLINVHTISMPLIDKSIDYYTQSGKSEFSLIYQGKTYLVTYQPVAGLENYGWLVGVIAPRSDFTGVLQRMNWITLLVSFSILLIGIYIVSTLVSKIVKPINILSKEAEKIEKFELEGEINISSRIKEVVKLTDSMDSMKAGLRHFQLYVPKMLVRQLIESGENITIGGEKKELVVLFSDIENFTSIAEKVDANELIHQVCEYFDVLTKIILREKGTIDKYIGDSVMAFWGAPLPEDKPCDRAARSALQCQKKLEELNENWAKQGKPRLVTRIGIHAGEAIVGNFGSTERLNYTALGDTVNLSSRLESINKTYKTKIIVSEEVYQHIKNRFVLRMIDCVAVKGRSTVSCIYELLGADPRFVPFDVNAYQAEFDKGFSAMNEANCEEAIKYFKACLKIYPNDTVAPLFIERCRKLK